MWLTETEIFYEKINSGIDLNFQKKINTVVLGIIVK